MLGVKSSLIGRGFAEGGIRCVGAVIVAVVLSSGAQIARAEDANVGIGVVIGEPAGLTAQLKGSDAGTMGTVLNAALGFEFLDGNQIHLQLDYVMIGGPLLHNVDTELIYYFGLGAFVRDHKNVSIGARVPFGVQLEFRRQPIHVFLEVVPRLTIVEQFDVHARGALGFRYFF